MTNITVSIIIPVFNNGYLAEEMIMCIINQSFTNWELIIVDDKSTDETIEIIKKYEILDKRIKILVRENKTKGSAACRNIGYANSKGKFIIHFDADDLITPTCLEERIEFMENNPTADYASFPAKSFSNSSKLPNFNQKGKTWGVGSDSIDLLSNFLKADYPFSVWNNIYKRESIKSIRWDTNVKIYTDFSFIISGILLGLKHKFSNMKKLDYYYRTNYSGANMCSTFISQEKCESTLYLFRQILSSISARSDYMKRKRELKQFIYIHFERLVLSGTNNQIHDYLEFIKEEYDSIIIITKMKLVMIVSSLIKDIKLKKIVIYLLMATVFCHKRYQKIFLNKLGF